MLPVRRETVYGRPGEPYINTAGKITRAVLYGLLITALARGLMAGVGYRMTGIQGPVLLGVLTGVLSVVPAIGTAIVWVPLSAWLLMTGPVWKGILLLVWGFVLVHPIDNVLRPFLISNVTRVPFLLVMFGAIGGLAAFGLVGVFVGPALLGVAMAIWREWAMQGSTSDADGLGIGSAENLRGSSAFYHNAPTARARRSSDNDSSSTALS